MTSLITLGIKTPKVMGKMKHHSDLTQPGAIDLWATGLTITVSH